MSMRSLRGITYSAFSLIVIALLSMSIQAKVGPVKLEELAKQSEVIVVGRVLSVNNIKGVNFANVEILQTLKGTFYTNIYYSAEKLWACDVSTAVDGETALFFFKKYDIKPNLFRNIRETNLLKEEVEKSTNFSDLFRLAYDGRGRVPIKEIRGEKLLLFSESVILPKGLKPEPKEVIDYTNKIVSGN